MKQEQSVTISAPNFQVAEFTIVGDAPYVQNKFSAKAKEMMHQTQAAGSTARKGKQRQAKDFDEVYRQAQHVAHDGWHGIPAASFRAALISACRLVGFQMTKAKLAVFIIADGFDADEGTPLVRITKGEPQYVEHMVRNATGVADLRARALWREGWEARLRVRFDADLFTMADVANLLLRAGQQVGVGEGRPDSKQSTGMGWGTFAIRSEA